MGEPLTASVESQLRDSEERYRALFTSMAEGFCIIEVLFDDTGRAIDYRFLEVNPAFERQSGLRNVAGRTMRELAPMHEEHWFEIFGRVAMTGEPASFTNHARVLQRWFDVFAFRTGDPRRHHVALLFNDVTGRKRAEFALRGSENQLRLILESAVDYALVVSDCHRRITAWNKGAERLLGYTQEEILNQCADILFTPEDRAEKAPERETRIASETGRAINERWHVRKDGTRFWGSGMMFPLQDGTESPHGYLKIMQDRTAEQHTQEYLRWSEERLRIAVETAQLGTWSYNLRTLEGIADERTREFFGFPADAPPDYDAFMEAIHPEDRPRVHEAFQNSIRGHNRGRFRDEYRITAADTRRERWIRAASQTYFDYSGQATHCVGTVIDITDLVKAREILARRGEELERIVADRTSALRDTVQQLETVSYSVVHDMRAPLRAVSGYADILRSDYGPQLDDTARGYLDRMKMAVERMDALITDVLGYSQMSTSEAEPAVVDLDALIHEIVEQYPQFQERSQCVQIRSPLPAVLGNRALLTQCISNLLDNALKFVQPGQIPRVIIHAQSSVREVRLWIEDQGVGIAPEHRERIFGLFQRLHRPEQYPGTGVGLAIVRKAVERMGGRVGVDSKPGQGSRFWIELPAPEP